MNSSFYNNNNTSFFILLILENSNCFEMFISYLHNGFLRPNISYSGQIMPKFDLLRLLRHIIWMMLL